MILVSVRFQRVAVNIDDKVKVREGKTNIFMHVFVASEVLADAGIGKFQNPKKEKAEEADFFCKCFRNPTVQQGAEQEGKTETEAAYAVNSGNLFLRKIYLVGAISSTGNKGVQAQGKNEKKYIENHSAMPFFTIIFMGIDNLTGGISV